MIAVPTHHPIVIIGAGLGELTAARVLHTRGIEAVILELEPDRNSRVQGGMLDIHEPRGASTAGDPGGRAVRSVHQDHPPGGPATRIFDHTGTHRAA